MLSGLFFVTVIGLFTVAGFVSLTRPRRVAAWLRRHDPEWISRVPVLRVMVAGLHSPLFAVVWGAGAATFGTFFVLDILVLHW